MSLQTIGEYFDGLGIYKHPAIVLTVLAGLFSLSWIFYFYSILEYQIFKIRMIQLLIKQLNKRAAEFAKKHNTSVESIEIYYDTNGFGYRVYNEQGEALIDNKFKP